MKKLITIALIINSFASSHAQENKSNTMDCNPTIDVFGTKQSIITRNFIDSVKLHDINLSSTAVGYGPSAGYKDEITIIDGQFHIATATSKTTLNLSNTISDDIGAVFLVTSSPDKWMQFKVQDQISGTKEIVDLIAQQLKANGCDQQVSIPFKITADAEQIKWSIVGRPKGASSIESNQKVTIIGIYSTLKSNGYFLPKNFEIHAHVNIPNKNITGHLRNIETLKNISIYLPAK